MAISVPIVSTWDATGVDKSLRDIQKAEGGWAKAGEGVKAAALPAAAALGVLSVAGFGAVKAAEESAAANAALDKVLSQMGYPENAAAAKAYADELSRATGIDDEAIIKAQTKLATFSEVAKSAGLMGQATKTAADLSAAGFGSMDQASVMLGKALQDPIKGIGSLSRVGVTFTDSEKAMVASMVATGDQAGAQQLIMAALEKQVGGVAEATATDSAKMQTAWGNLVEEIGTALLPMFGKLTDMVLAGTRIFSEHSGIIVGVGVAIAGVSAAILVINGLMKAWQAATLAVSAVQLVLNSNLVLAAALTAKATASIIAQNVAQAASKVVTLAGAVVSGIATAATTAQAAATWVLNAALAVLTSPILLVVAAVALLVGGLVLAYRKSDTFRNMVDGAFRAVGRAASWMADTIGSAIQAALAWIQRMIDKIGDLVGKMNPLKSMGGMFGGGLFGRSYAPATASAARAAGGTRGAASAYGSVVINVNGQDNPYEAARAVKRALEGYDQVQGRTPWTPLAKAW